MRRSQELFVCALILITSISIVYGLTNTKVIEVPIITTTTETDDVPPFYIMGNVISEECEDNVMIYIENGTTRILTGILEGAIRLPDGKFYAKNFINKSIYGMTAYDCIFTNCTIDNSVLHHCRLNDSNVTRTFVYASLFEYWYTVRYVDCSGGRVSYNTTTWLKNP